MSLLLRCSLLLPWAACPYRCVGQFEFSDIAKHACSTMVPSPSAPPHWRAVASKVGQQGLASTGYDGHSTLALSSRYNAMLALLLARLATYVHLYRSGVINVGIYAEPFMSPTILFRSHRPVPDTNAVAVKLPNAMECYNAVTKPCKPTETDSSIDALRQTSVFIPRPLICCFPFPASPSALSIGRWLS